MCSSVKQTHYESSLSPISDMTHDDTEGTAKQNKSMLQKKYREKEVDGFAELREAIREATDDQEIPRTRHETLAKGECTKGTEPAGGLTI
jgi:hypothetical protein